jgi:hypothetical protein
MRDDGGSTGAEIEAPAPQDNPFHAVVHLNEAGGGQKVKVDLIAVDAGGEKNMSIVSQDYEVGGINNNVDVTFSLPRDWPTGQYRVDAYVNGQLSKSKEFTVQ